MNGSLGSYSAPDRIYRHSKNELDVQDCVWVLNTHNSVRGMSVGLGGDGLKAREAIIQLTIHQGARIFCPTNYVYIYDGLPDFMSLENGWTRQNHLLGAYCSPQTVFSLNVHAHSGIMTIFYRRNDVKQGYVIVKKFSFLFISIIFSLFLGLMLLLLFFPAQPTARHPANVLALDAVARLAGLVQIAKAKSVQMIVSLSSVMESAT